MTRARLDGVVAMVDADLLSHQLRAAPSGAEPSGKSTAPAEAQAAEPAEPAEPAAQAQAAEVEAQAQAVEVEAQAAEAAGSSILAAAGAALWRQLQCADVVVLNKADLLAEADLAAVASRVAAAAPWAR
eukprot:43387-Prymnesium_polylepis.1